MHNLICKAEIVIENRHMETEGEKEKWKELGDWYWSIYTIDTMYETYNCELTV